jgi:hypothetical protein
LGFGCRPDECDHNAKLVAMASEFSSLGRSFAVTADERVRAMIEADLGIDHQAGDRSAAASHWVADGNAESRIARCKSRR